MLERRRNISTSLSLSISFCLSLSLSTSSPSPWLTHMAGLVLRGPHTLKVYNPHVEQQQRPCIHLHCYVAATAFFIPFKHPLTPSACYCLITWLGAKSTVIRTVNSPFFRLLQSGEEEDLKWDSHAEAPLDGRGSWHCMKYPGKQTAGPSSSSFSISPEARPETLSRNCKCHVLKSQVPLTLKMIALFA